MQLNNNIRHLSAGLLIISDKEVTDRIYLKKGRTLRQLDVEATLVKKQKNMHLTQFRTYYSMCLSAFFLDVVNYCSQDHRS